MWQVTFKCPGGGTITIHNVNATDGHAARRLAILMAIGRGYSRQCGHWASRVTRVNL